MALTLELLRADDLLNLQVECHNLKLDSADAEAPVLVSSDAEKDCHLVFVFPPQTVAEMAFFETAPTPAPPGQPPPTHPAPATIETPVVPVKSRIGGASRLVFRIPANAETRIPYSIDGLLNWLGYELSVSTVADVPENPKPAQITKAGPIKAPDALETAIELPYRLVLSPNHEVRWTHSARVVTHQSRTELWHTRLTSIAPDGTSAELSRTNNLPLRAIWSPDYDPKNAPPMSKLDPDLQLTAMSPYDRHAIVVLTSAFGGYVNEDDTDFLPLPVHAEQLILSPLGGWLKSHGKWDPPYKWHSFLAPFEVTPWNEFFITRNIRRLGAREREPAPAQAREVVAEPATGIVNELAIAKIGAFHIPSRFGFKDGLLSLSEWIHNATLGRDHYVQIVYEGHLYPFGHRAALIKVTERQIRHMSGKPLAYLVQRMFIVVREPVKEYSGVPADNFVTGKIPEFAHYERYLPFRRIRLTSLKTPDIEHPSLGKGHIPGTDFSTWVRVNIGGVFDDFKFTGVKEDFFGKKAEFAAPLIFIPFSESAANRVTVANVYALSGDRRTCVVQEAKLTFAPPDPAATTDNTTFVTRKLFFGSRSFAFNKKYGGFLPTLFKSGVRVPAIEQLLGRETTTDIALTSDYQSNGLVNPGTVFAQVVREIPGDAAKNILPHLEPDKFEVAFQAKQAGGIATPNLSVSCLSREFGTLAGKVAEAAANNFKPADFFPKGSAQLFGVLDLSDLIVELGTMADNAPKMEIGTENGAAPKLVTKLQWNPKVKNLKFGILNFIAKNPGTGVPSKLEIKARLEKPITIPPVPSPPPTSRFSGSLTDFAFDFLNVILLRFKEFNFESINGSKMNVDVKLDSDQPVKFQGDLDFVEKLRELIPPGLLGNGPSLDINTQRIRAGFAIALPPAAVGVFALKGVSLAAALELPFSDGKPTFDFSFSERQHPFCLTVALFGGGGFFHLQLDTNGIKQLEAALEFGAVAALDIGVASGSVHIMAGIYFAMQKKDAVMMALLSGYFRAGGELSVLGIVSISVEFNLSFIYYLDAGKCKGRATLTVTIEIAFFSKSIELSVEKSFGKGGGDPTFAQLMNAAAVWDEYASAFA